MAGTAGWTDAARCSALAGAAAIAWAWAAGPAASWTASAAQPLHVQGERRGASPAAVFGPDDRVALPPHLQGLQSSLGILFNVRARSVCTAFCVGADVVATAAHCLYRTSGEKPPLLTDFWFARSYDALRDFARIAGHATGAAAQNVVAGSQRLSVQPPIDATSDWALIRLNRPVCARAVLPLAPATPDEIALEAAAGRLFQASYHRDLRQWRPAYSKPCQAGRAVDGVEWSAIAQDFSAPEGLLLHTCDTGGASSGSPLLIETVAGPKVVGINVGVYVQSRIIMQNGQVMQRMKAETIANTGVASGVFAPMLAMLSQARIIATAAGIREVQSRLKQRGHYEGRVDGTFGPALKLAIEAFERGEKLAISGLASEALLARLREPLEPAKGR